MTKSELRRLGSALSILSESVGLGYLGTIEGVTTAALGLLLGYALQPMGFLWRQHFGPLLLVVSLIPPTGVLVWIIHKYMGYVHRNILTINTHREYFIRLRYARIGRLFILCYTIGIAMLVFMYAAGAPSTHTQSSVGAMFAVAVSLSTLVAALVASFERWPADS